MKGVHWGEALAWTAATVGCYLVGLGARRWSRRHPLANPVLIAIALLAGLLRLTGTAYADYFRATWVLTFLLGPATAALGIALARNLAHVRRNLGGIALGLGAGSVTAMVTGVALVRLLGGSRTVALSMLPKAVTTPIAIAISAEIGGQPALTAALAIVGGILTAITLRFTLGRLRVTHGHALGLAAGTAGSGIAAAYIAALGDGPAAFAAIGIGLNGLVTALLAPMVAGWLR